MLAEICDLIDEGNLASQHRVRRVFHHLGAAHIAEENRIALTHKRVVELAHHCRRVLAFDAADNAIGFHKITDRIAFFKELRIVSDVEGQRCLRTNEIAHCVTRTNRHSALYDNSLGSGRRTNRVDRIRDVACHLQDILQIRAAIFTTRRAHANEDDLGVAIGRELVRGKRKATKRSIALDHVAQTRLINRTFAAAQHRDLRGIDIKALHFVSCFGEASACDKPDIARSNHGQSHA